MIQQNDEKSNIQKLADLLESANVKVTFSRWCISGIVKVCYCSRCLRGRGEEVTEETERAAEERSKVESKAFRERVWASWNEQQQKGK